MYWDSFGVDICFSWDREHWQRLTGTRVLEYTKAVPPEWVDAGGSVDAAISMIRGADLGRHLYRGAAEDTDMGNQEQYSFVTLRYVHNIVLEEFMNVGVVMYVPGTGRMLSKANPDPERIKGAFPDLKGKSFRNRITSITQGMKSIEQEINAVGKGHDCNTALDCAQLVIPADDSALQWSHIGYGWTPNVDKTFASIYNHLVTRYDRLGQFHISDIDIWRKVTSAIKRREIKVKFQSIQITGRTDKVKFLHALNSNCWHIYEPLSFDLPAECIKDKARRVLGQLTAVKEGATEDVHVHFIVGRPQKKSLMGVYTEALSILDLVPFKHDIYEDSNADKVVQTMKTIDWLPRPPPTGD